MPTSDLDPTSPTRATRIPSWLVGAAVYLVALLVYAAHGPRGKLLHDHALFVYSGQQLAEGTPPYVSLFDHKGPVAPFLCAAGVGLGRLLGSDDLLTVRLLFLVLCAASAAGIYWLALALFQSRSQALLSCATFIAFRGYGVQAISGPEPKTIAVLCGIFALLAMTRRAFFLSGLCAALAALTWQPSGIYCIAAIAIGWFHTTESSQRRRAAGAALVGSALPLVLVSLYFVGVGAFGDFVDGLLLFNVQHVEHTGSFKRTLGFLMSAAFHTYHGMGIAIALGLGALLMLYPWRARRAAAGGLRFLFRDRFAAILVSLPFPVIWSLNDFQGYADMFILLPYAALGFGWILAEALAGSADRLSLGPRVRGLATAGTLVVLLLSALFIHAFKRPGRELELQRVQARGLMAELSTDARVVSIGAPEVLVLTQRRNATRYGFILRGVPNFIQAHEEGGFRGWLEGLSGADRVLVNPIARPLLPDELALSFDNWIAQLDALPRVGPWEVYAEGE